MMVGPVEPPRHRTVTALRSSQLSLSFSALCRHWPPPQNAAARPVIAAIRAERSILFAETSVCGQTFHPLSTLSKPNLGSLSICTNHMTHKQALRLHFPMHGLLACGASSAKNVN
jgi:hypothetical protein